MFHLLMMTLFFAPTARADEPAPSMDPDSMLAHADIDGDGEVTRDEFMAHRATLFTAFDTDDSDALSRDEFVAAIAPIKGAFMARMGFGRIDADGDGRIELSEWNANPPRAFDKANTNGDDRLDAAEIAAARRRG